MLAKTEVWNIKGFMAGEVPGRIEGGILKEVKVAVIKASAIYLATHGFFGTEYVLAAGDGPVSRAFDHKIWPVLLDIGKPLAKTMMCIGIYKCIRNDVDSGWKMTWRSGVGLAGLYLIDGAIDIIAGIGEDLSNVETDAGVKR